MTRRDTAQRAVDDRGSTTLTTVVLTPVFLVIALMAFQAALWTHARTEARVIARDSAALVARSHADAAATEQSALAMLHVDSDLTGAAVDIAVNGDLVRARVTGRAPGMIPGTSAGVDVVEAVPREEFRP
jgi:Flp pilus assembly protein TadG